MAHHILKGDISSHNLCGFCGKEGCDIKIKITSKKGNKRFFKIIRWDCPYYDDYGKKRVYGKNNRTSNHLMFCGVKDCTSVIWLFNIEKHYEVKHNGTTPPTLITPEEVQYLKNNKF